MRNLLTPLYEPLLPDPETRQSMDFWERELEKLCSEYILRWAIETYGTKVAFASSWGVGDDIIRSLFEKLAFQIPVVDRIHHLLLPEGWVPLASEETRNKTFDGRSASAALWARFTMEHFCKQRESTIRCYPVWIVAARRDQDPAFQNMPILSWIERFGVLRIAPIARWRHHCIEEEIRRETVPDAEAFVIERHEESIIDFTPEETKTTLATHE